MSDRSSRSHHVALDGVDPAKIDNRRRSASLDEERTEQPRNSLANLAVGWLLHFANRKYGSLEKVVCASGDPGPLRLARAGHVENDLAREAEEPVRNSSP